MVIYNIAFKFSCSFLSIYFLMYNNLFSKGINLIFLKEPHINTDTYKSALQGGIPTTGTNIDCILEGINKYLLSLAKNGSGLRLNSQKRKYKASDRGLKKDCRPPGFPVNRLDKSLEGNSQPKNLLLQRQLS